ncbi:OLC1v1037430C1 [Oldenlandia corymbosa var. corymbosa]|uniref:OLC1v1037430C1 n=1 Tax=Oldenlandia corymbosa var. corymbosa TaxID=529605 RepID=A0AAV1D0V7_OLDCO|nr:OLC1v1037430C1 [Oldenlandia corymbosa var. corymbosa]
MFPTPVAQNIMSMYLPVDPNSHHDQLIWGRTSTGIYTVKSGYYEAINLKEANIASSYGNSTKSLTEAGWKKFWALKLPAKIQWLIWRAVTNALPTLSGSNKRVMQLSAVCMRCSVGIEIVQHLFLDCIVSKRAWRYSPLGFDFDKSDGSSFAEWLNDWILTAPDLQSIQFSLFMCWGIWLARNENVWEEAVVSPVEILRRAQQYFQIFNASQHGDQRPAGLTESTELTSQVLPGVQIHVDGAFNNHEKIGAAAWECIDQYGRCLHCGSCTFLSYTPLHAEAMACLKGLQVAKELGISQCVLQSDNAAVVKLGSKSVALPYPLHMLGSDICKLRDSFALCSFMKVDRSIVENAHKLDRVSPVMNVL